MSAILEHMAAVGGAAQLHVSPTHPQLICNIVGGTARLKSARDTDVVQARGSVFQERG
jgi:hypothetical protein